MLLPLAAPLHGSSGSSGSRESRTDCAALHYERLVLAIPPRERLDRPKSRLLPAPGAVADLADEVGHRAVDGDGHLALADGREAAERRWEEAERMRFVTAFGKVVGLGGGD